MSPQHLDMARRFARCLDEEDYPGAFDCLAPDCRYEVAGRTHVGPSAIIASYRKSGSWAARTLDEIHYESSVRSESDACIAVEFVDFLVHAGIRHTHRCKQLLEFDMRGRINHIKHVDLTGEREALARFLDSAGLADENTDAGNG